ncbi:hypothetical protein KY290_000988 [Solanum tuberosum]|uniref:CCHC-type domain-containing protein n=1 Tax=Solanum tuberosum TaxID=4113 RepID=A0ABQ7WL06_SOLTU|nr:hypothetical protein KY290_000988 [Solanum tuberosum]
MKCISFDRDIIDIHFQKMARIYFELGGDSSLKQAFLSSLPKMLAGHAMTIFKDMFKSITIPHIALDKACSRSDLVTKFDCSYLSHRAGRKTVKQYRRFKLPRPPDNPYRMTRRTKFFRRRSPCNYRTNDHCFICNKPGHFAKNCPQSKRSFKTLQIFDDIADHTGIYLSRDDDLELVFSLEDEPMSETLFTIDVYEMAGDDTNIDDDPGHNMYQISNTKIVDFPREVDTSHVQLAIYSSNGIKFTPSKEILMTTLITKHPVIIEFFPGLQFPTKLLGSVVPERDLIIEFDIYTQLKD